MGSYAANSADCPVTPDCDSPGSIGNMPIGRNIFAWIPYLWSRVVFSGRSPDAAASAGWMAWLLILLVPGLLLYPRLHFRLLEPDEARYAEIPREMLERGEWIVPYLQGEPYLDKPPLLYWLVMASFKVFGIADWSARLIPALMIHLAILTTFFFGRRLVGPRAALWGAMLLSLAPGFITIGKLLTLDGLLALWVTLSLFATFEALRDRELKWGHWLLAASAVGLGILTKGPIALILLVPPFAAYHLLAGAAHRPRLLEMGAFLAVAVGICTPWYVAMIARVPGFAHHFFWVHNVQRFLTPFDHQRPMWFYLPILAAGFLPATLLAPWFFRFLVTGQSDAARRRTPEMGFLLLASGWCLAFFTLSGSKLPTYILPAYPPLALALGAFASIRLGNSLWLPRGIAVAAWLFLMGLHHILIPWYADYRSPMAKAEEVARLCGNRTDTLICHPRSCDSISFYLKRDDLRYFRSKEMEPFVHFLLERRRTVVLFTHRHSLEGFHHFLPPTIRVVESSHQGLGKIPGVPDRFLDAVSALFGETALGLADIAVVECDAPP